VQLPATNAAANVITVLYILYTYSCAICYNVHLAVKAECS